jgi:hypothetical protein
MNREELEQKLKELGKSFDTFLLGLLIGIITASAATTQIYTNLINSIEIIQRLKQ